MGYIAPALTHNAGHSTISVTVHVPCSVVTHVQTLPFGSCVASVLSAAITLQYLGNCMAFVLSEM